MADSELWSKSSPFYCQSSNMALELHGMHESMPIVTRAQGRQQRVRCLPPCHMYGMQPGRPDADHAIHLPVCCSIRICLSRRPLSELCRADRLKLVAAFKRYQRISRPLTVQCWHGLGAARRRLRSRALRMARRGGFALQQGGREQR